MRDKDHLLLEEAYQLVKEGMFTPDIQEALRKASALLKAKQEVPQEIKDVISQDPMASQGLIKMYVEYAGVTTRLPHHVGDSVWNSIKSNTTTARELAGWLRKFNIEVTELYN